MDGRHGGCEVKDAEVEKEEAQNSLWWEMQRQVGEAGRPSE